MREAYHVSIRLLLRSKRYILSYAVIFVVSFIAMLTLQPHELSTVDFLTSSLMLGILGVVYFSFASFELTSELHIAGGDECVSAAPNAKRNLLLSQIITLIVPLFIWSALIFGWQVIDYMQRGLAYSPYLLHCFLAVFLYCFLPGLLGILLGSCFAGIYRPTAYFLIIFGALLCSSVVAALFANVEVAGIPLASIFDWFSITVPNSKWLADTAYGVAMENCRWILAAFWALLLLSIILWKYRAKKNLFEVCIAGLCLIGALFCGVRFGLRGNDSILIKDKRPDGILYGENNYRMSKGSEDVIAADFTAEKYELILNIDESLDAVATIHVFPTDLEQYCFTLYHGYKVSSVTNESGERLSFTQEGDYLEIISTGNTKALTVSYSGNGNKYFANKQGISLPGYFSYYPMAGHLPVWDFQKAAFFVNTDFNDAEFYVKVNSHNKVYSNLKTIGENTFEGVTDTVSLYAGLIVETDINGVTYIYSPLSGQPTEIDKAKVTEEWKYICALTGETRELSLDGKIVIYQPLTTTAFAGQNESAVILGDQVLVSDYQSSPEVICYSYFESSLLEQPDTGLLRQVFLDSLFSKTASNIVEKPSYDAIQMLFKYNSAGEIFDVDEWQEYLYESNVLFYQLMEYQIAHLGKKYVMQEIYQYLTNENESSRMNQVEFLYYMGDDNDA